MMLAVGYARTHHDWRSHATGHASPGLHPARCPSFFLTTGRAAKGLLSVMMTVPAPPISARRITLERIEAAARAIDPVFLHTPQWVCEPLGEELGARVVLKAETLNPIRSFKGRGADWLVHNLPPGVALMCASAGNFGQAMACPGPGRSVRGGVCGAEQASRVKRRHRPAVGRRRMLAVQDF